MKKDGVLMWVSEEELELLKTNPKEFWKDVTEISEMAFSDCESLVNIEIPEGVVKINVNAFSGCKNLTSVTIPEGITKISKLAFSDCTSLTTVKIPSSVSKICEFAFSGCEKLCNINIPQSVTEIEQYAFSLCYNIKNVTIPSGITKIGENAFVDDFTCFYKSSSGELIISKEELSKEEITAKNIEKVIDVSKITNIDSPFFMDIKNNTEMLEPFFKQLSKFNISIPYEFIKKLKYWGSYSNFVNEPSLKGFTRVNKKLPVDIAKNDSIVLFSFAYNIGCFSKNPKLNQRANEWLFDRISKDKHGNVDININSIHSVLGTWFPEGENEEFSNFLFGKNNEKNSTNFSEIKLEPVWGLFLEKIYKEFKNSATYLDHGRYRNEDNGKLMFKTLKQTTNMYGEKFSKTKDIVPTVELFKQRFVDNKFYNIVTEQDKAIAAEFVSWPGMFQEHFDEAKSIMKEFNDNKIPNNIVGKHLKDITNDIENYKTQTQSLATQGIASARNTLDCLDEKIKKEFTYDWLEKNDPANFCLGLYCDCCANLDGLGYGIMHSNFVRDDIQNLAIRNKNEVIIAKATLYVNKKEGYGVFNTVEVTNQTINKEEIYSAFMEGVDAFAEEYNKQNPTNPLKKINVGTYVNGLYKQIEMGCKPSEILQGIDFGKYGVRNQVYPGSWKGGQSTVWEHHSKKDLGDLAR